ncbi:MAG: aldo/keto reductase, partial [Sphingobacteriales bacterium]
DQIKPDRGTLTGRALNEDTYTLLDEMNVIAKSHGTTIPAVALAWVQSQPGVTSTIIGARRIEQLEENINSLDVRLSQAALAHLDELSRPTLGFPHRMLPLLPGMHNGGTSINGVTAPSTVMPFGSTPY